MLLSKIFLKCLSDVERYEITCVILDILIKANYYLFTICLGTINMFPALFTAQISAHSGKADPKSAMENSFTFGSTNPTLFRCASLTSTTANSESCDEMMERSETVMVVVALTGLNHLLGFCKAKVSQRLKVQG